MNNHLTPQLRADKNGKLVTRHIKPVSAGTTSAGKVPAPSISAAQKFRIPERDVKRTRRAGTTKQAMEEAKKIKAFFGVPSTQSSDDPIRMSDNEILDYMQEGYSATAAVEFKRWGIAPETAVMGTLMRFSVKESVKRMRALDLTPEEATKIIRNGMTDRLLDKYLTDNELFGLLHEERLSSPTYPERAKGVENLVLGVCTREDYQEFPLEVLGKYGGYLSIDRREGRKIDYDVFRRTIERVESVQEKLPEVRYHEGWAVGQYEVGFHALHSLVRKHGPDVLDFKYLNVFRMGHYCGDTMEGYQFLDKFFIAAEEKRLPLTSKQRDDIAKWSSNWGSAAVYTEVLYNEGMTPEQVIESITSGLTIEQAKQIHLHQQAPAMIEGWL